MKGILGLLISLLVFFVGSADSFGFTLFPPDLFTGIVKMLVNIPSLMVIAGGSLFQVFACFPGAQVLDTLKGLLPAKGSAHKAVEADHVDDCLVWVKGMRKNRAQVLKETAEQKTDEFRCFLAELISTDYTAEEIAVLGDIKIQMIQEEETVPVLVSNMLAGASPAFGMLGTLMGLIVMLGNFSDTSGLASGMALALMTTFYGMMFIQFFWFPLAKKFTRASRLNTRRRERELAAILLLLEGKPDMYISDQLTTMSRD